MGESCKATAGYGVTLTEEDIKRLLHIDELEDKDIYDLLEYAIDKYTHLHLDISGDLHGCRASYYHIFISEPIDNMEVGRKELSKLGIEYPVEFIKELMWY